MAFRRFGALLLIAVYLSSTASGLVPNGAAVSAYVPTFDLAPPVPAFTSEAPMANFTILYPVPKPSPIMGQISVLIIAVEFSDYNHTLPIEQVAYQTINQLNLYYAKVSYGAASVVGKAVGWVRVPRSMSSYGMDNGPFIDDQDNDGYPDSWRLLQDVVSLLAKDVNVTAYQHVIVLHAGFGQESSRQPKDIWSVTYIRWRVETVQGNFDQFAVVPEYEAQGFGTLGVYAHEFGHLLGLPDLYSYTEEQVGLWDLMARGAWNGNPPGSSPAEMTAWDRMFLGWITSDRILDITKPVKVNATLNPIESSSPGLRAIRVQASYQDSRRYYLVEVRQKVGYDSALPSSGVLITYIDETQSNPVKVIDAVRTTSTLDDAPFQTGQKYSDGEASLVISIGSTDGSSFFVVVDTTSPSPDIVIQSLTVNPSTVRPNNTVSVSVLIKNEGTLRASSFLVELFLNETLFASREISLEPNEIQEIRSSWKPIKPGVYIFRAVADPQNVLSEATKDNNSKVLTLVVGYTLTLQIRPPGAGGDVRWWLAVNGVNQTFVGVGEFRFGVVPGSNTLHIQPLIYLNPNARCVFRQWGDGSTSNPRTINVSNDVTLSVDFSPQYRLSLEPNGGTTSAGGWYDSGTLATISATSPSNVVDKKARSVFLNWSGDVKSNSTSLTVNMTRPCHVIANWKTQYYLQVASPYSTNGEGWYDANTQATVTLSTPVTTQNGTRQVFREWLGDLSGAQTSQPIVMSGPRFVAAVWVTEYELKVHSEYGHVSGAGWYTLGTRAPFIVDTLVIDSANRTRRVFTEWSGDASGIGQQGSVLMDAPKVVRAGWGTEYEVAFEGRGIRNGTALTVIVDGVPFRTEMPGRMAFWKDSGSSISFFANATLTDGFRRSIFMEWRNSTGAVVDSPQKVLKPETYTAVYKELSISPCIIATVTFGSELSPEVQFLRDFRDHLVLSTRAGSAFMNVFNMWYYSFSPQVANFITSHDTTRSPVRVALYPLIGILELSSVTYSALAFAPEFAIVTTGVLASALIGVVYLTPINLFLARALAKKKIRGTFVLSVSLASCLVAIVMLAVGELAQSSPILALASSSLVLIVLVSAPLLFSFALTQLADRLGLPSRVARTLSRFL